MSLLFYDSSSEQKRLADIIFERQLEQDESLRESYDQYRKGKMKRDISYNLKFLDISIRYEADMIYEDYADWLVRLMLNRMDDVPADQVKEQMVTHYKIIGEVFQEELPAEQVEQALHHLENAVAVTREVEVNPTSVGEDEGLLGGIRQNYLKAILEFDRQGAQTTIDQALESGVSIEDIYLEVFQKTMYKIGQLWHEGIIAVDEEHYATGVTQQVMMGLWPKIFASPRNGRKVTACCVGQELHEMGMRMLCDLMEMQGWDSIYLGAAVPNDAIIKSLRKNKPDLVALSVTMPTYLDKCKAVIDGIRADEEIKDLAIAVGGRAFQLAPHLVEQWGIDLTAENGIQLAESYEAGRE
ncbi:MAG: cobalamin B12-binding domain-containing protein [Bacillota bacterium]